MGRVLTILHTTPVIIGLIDRFAKEIIPSDVTIRTVVDDSLLADTRKSGRLTHEVTRRVVGYVQHAEMYGSDCVLFTCSSVGPAIDVARQVVNIPVIKIDEPMAQEAAERGSSIAVLATVPTTIPPTEVLIRDAAAKVGKHITVDAVLCGDAFDALGRGDVEMHNALLVKQVEDLAMDHDVVVLAQASMTNLLPELSAALATKVITSPRLGLLHTADLLKAMAE